MHRSYLKANLLLNRWEFITATRHLKKRDENQYLIVSYKEVKRNRLH